MVLNFDNTKKRLWEFIGNNKLQQNVRSLFYCRTFRSFYKKGHGGKEFMF